MNTLEKSAESISQYLSTVSDEDFLAVYKSVATKEGVTVNEYLDDSYVKEYFATCVFSIYNLDARYQATIIDELFGEMDSINSAYAANDDNASLAA